MTTRTTVQTTAILKALGGLGHATNKQIWATVSKDFPDVSLTTIHRATQRLKERGVVGCAPTLSGESMLDANPEPHSHFMCRNCSLLKDVKLDDSTIDSLQAQLSDEIIEKCLFISGTCRTCYASIHA